jgi:hypothetical protein
MTTKADGEPVLQPCFRTGRTLVHRKPHGVVFVDSADRRIQDQLTHVFQLVDQRATHAHEAFIHLHHQVMDFQGRVDAGIAFHVTHQIGRNEFRQDTEGHFIALGAGIQLRLLLAHWSTPWC